MTPLAKIPCQASKVDGRAISSTAAINTEYTPGTATKQKYTVDLKPLGGTFEIDRVLNELASAQETAFQMAQKIKSTSCLFRRAFLLKPGLKNSRWLNGVT